MKQNISIFLLLFSIASLSAISISRNGIIEINQQPAISFNNIINNVSADVPRSSRVIRIKFCQTCHLDTHFNVSSPKCPFNQNFVGVKDQFCKKCQGTDHCSMRSSLCKFNRQNLLQDSHTRLCIDCAKDDHLNKKSNLCIHNSSGVLINNPTNTNKNTSPTIINEKSVNASSTRSFTNNSSLPTFDGNF